jgi:RNA polymerase sigma-70 factor (family 1)
MERTYHTIDEALRGLANEDHHAFRWIYDKYYHVVARVGNKYLQDTALTQDLIQEIFSSVWTKRGQFTSIDNFESYFFTMARNLAIQYIKGKAREVTRNRAYTHLKPAAENNIETYAMDKDLGHLVEKAVKALPHHHQRVFELCKQQGLCHQEVAHQLNLAPETVSNYMALALKSLRKYLDPHMVQVFLLCLLTF